MVTKLANRITDSLIRNNVVAAKDRVVSQYGMETLIVYALNIISVIILGFVLKLPLETLFMLLAFIKLRGCIGGIHAPNYLTCYIVSMATVFLSLKVIPLAVSLSIHPYILALLIFPFCGFIFLLSPVEDKNKPMDDIEKIVYRQRGLATLTVTLAVSLALIMLGLASLGYAVGLAIIIISISVVAGYFKNLIIDTMEKQD